MAHRLQRWGPYLQSCQWGFNMGKFMLSQISYPVVHCENSTLEGQISISCGQISPIIWTPPYIYKLNCLQYLIVRCKKCLGALFFKITYTA